MTARRHLLGLELAVCALGATVLAAMVLIGVDALRFHGSGLAATVLAVEALVLAAMAGSLARQVLRRRAFAARLPSTPRTLLGTDVRVIASRRAHAFTLGFLRPRIFVSEGLLELLSEPELECVLAHERHHARRRDPLRRALVQAIADGLWFIPALRKTARTHATVSELAADAFAMRRTGAQPLASALLAFEAHGTAGAGASTERVRFLLGEIERPAHALSLLVTGAILLALAGATVYLLRPVPTELCLPLSTALGAPLALLVLAAACVPAGLLGRAAERRLREG
ncbi:M56 family metallopeptidase [Solirubrobacter phytolaccae]|uniref:M56 family metallopeptidase n=1 Tax=Solirubrobacter phytolaccae TaxID=1404360 RepID=A0A9X3N504_9ACTN|nr:M56 family metallopeptidase [Solirubrobacter phytolaccae]MDA0179828.1 M56 family metallopeptidase [Solirubrobacter phytolaccae]